MRGNRRNIQGYTREDSLPRWQSALFADRSLLPTLAGAAGLYFPGLLLLDLASGIWVEITMYKL